MRIIDTENYNIYESTEPPTVSIGKVINDISNLLGYKILEEHISNLISTWNNAANKYNNYECIKNEIEKDILDCDKKIHALNTAIKILRSINKDLLSMHVRMYERNLEKTEINPSNSNLSFTKDTDDNQAAIEIQIYRINFTRHLLLIKLAEIKNRNHLFSFGIFSIFYFGAFLGLKIKEDHKPGRGKKNKMLELVRIITGIDEKKSLNRYRDQYFEKGKDEEHGLYFGHIGAMISKYQSLTEYMQEWLDKEMSFSKNKIN